MAAVAEEESLERLCELVRFVARALVDEPEAVQVHAVGGERAVVLELAVAEDDLGKVIGREGRTARALRTVLSATGAREGKRVVLEILE